MSIELARELRKRMPPAEARMWNLLRAQPLVDRHFRRQVPIGPYYADFASHGARLAIEVDGDTHAAREGYDRARDTVLRAEGYCVLRVTNREVMNNLDGVAATIAAALAAAPTRPLRGHPPHEGEGEGAP